MFEVVLLIQLLVWPCTVLALASVAYRAFESWRHPTAAESELASLRADLAALALSQSRTAERVGQLEMAQGVKRGR